VRANRSPTIKAGIETLVKHWEKLQPALIVPEANGGVEHQLTRALASAQIPVVVVNPRQVREFFTWLLWLPADVTL